jgi:hypothetical protein
VADEFDPPANQDNEADSESFWFASGPKGTNERASARDVDTALELQGQSRMQRELVAKTIYDATDNKNLSPAERRQAQKDMRGYQKQLGVRFDWAAWRAERKARGEKS